MHILAVALVAIVTVLPAAAAVAGLSVPTAFIPANESVWVVGVPVTAAALQNIPVKWRLVAYRFVGTTIVADSAWMVDSGAGAASVGTVAARRLWAVDKPPNTVGVVTVGDFDGDGVPDFAVTLAKQTGAVCGKTKVTTTWMMLYSGRTAGHVTTTSPIKDICWNFNAPGSNNIALIYPTQQWSTLGVIFGPGHTELFLAPYYARTGWLYTYTKGAGFTSTHLYTPACPVNPAAPQTCAGAGTSAAYEEYTKASDASTSTSSAHCFARPCEVVSQNCVVGVKLRPHALHKSKVVLRSGVVMYVRARGCGSGGSSGGGGGGGVCVCVCKDHVSTHSVCVGALLPATCMGPIFQATQQPYGSGSNCQTASAGHKSKCSLNPHVPNGIIVDGTGSGSWVGRRLLFWTSHRVAQYAVSQKYSASQLLYDTPYLTNGRKDIVGRNYGLVAQVNRHSLVRPGCLQIVSRFNSAYRVLC